MTVSAKSSLILGENKTSFHIEGHFYCSFELLHQDVFYQNKWRRLVLN